MNGRRLWGTWLSLGLATSLPMCESDDAADHPGAGGADAGGEGPNAAGSPPRAHQAGGGAAAGSPSETSAGHAPSAGRGPIDEPGLAGAGGFGGSPGSLRCELADEGSSCCMPTDRSCDEVAADWCTFGGQGPTAELDSCCDNGQRRVCGAVVQGETGPELYWGSQVCTCLAQQCACTTVPR